MISITACEEATEFSCDTADFQEELDQHLEDITGAEIAYSIDNSESNCLTLKQHYEDYRSTLLQFEDCELSPEDQQDYDNGLELSEDALSNLPC